MKNKILFTVTNLNIIDEVKKIGIDKFVFPFSFFCVGVLNTYELKDIKEENSYLFINRILDTKDIHKLNEILHNLPKNIKGIIFEDLGLINVLKDINIEKILFLPHAATNYASINSYLRYVDTIIVSYDITEEEMEEIVAKANKEVSFFVFGPVSSMYSRRSLLTSYHKHFNIDYKNVKKLQVNDNEFIALENNYGTVVYHMPFYNGLSLLNKNAKYYFYFPLFLEDKQIIELLNNNLDNIESSRGFLDVKTIYKIKK